MFLRVTIHVQRRIVIMKKKALIGGAAALIIIAAASVFLLAGRSREGQSAVPPQALPAAATSVTADGAPFILRLSPAAKAVDVGVSDIIAVEFAREMDAASAENCLSLYGPDGAKVEGQTIVTGRTAEFRMSDILEYGKTYTAVLSGKLRDKAGNAVGKGSSWSFTTNSGISPRIRVKNNGSIILSDITGYDYYAQDENTRSAPAEFTVTNEGNADLVIWSLGFVSGEQEAFSLNAPASFPVTIPPGASSAFSIVFHPASKGKKTVYLKIRSNDVSFGFFNLMVTGTGV